MCKKLFYEKGESPKAGEKGGAICVKKGWWGYPSGTEGLESPVLPGNEGGK